jgi:hypothetical protein
VLGPDVLVTCSIVGTALFPLSPSMQSASTHLWLRDRIPPQVVRGLEEPARVGPFGLSVEFNEDIDAAAGTGLCAGNSLSLYPSSTAAFQAREDPRVLAFRATSGPFVEGGLCSISNLVSDRAAAPSNTVNIPFRMNAQVQTLWAGPYLSTATFADPRPLLASLGTYPRGQQRISNVPNPRPSPTELLVTEGTDLVPLVFDPYATTVCNSPCSLQTGTPISLGLDAGLPPQTQRAYWTGATLLVAVRPGVIAERSAGGSWALASVPGALMQNNDGVMAVSHDGGVLNLWTRPRSASSFVFAETVASGVAPLGELVGNARHLVGVSGSTMLAWARGTSTWSAQSLVTPPVGAGSLIFTDVGNGPPLHVEAFRVGAAYGVYRSGDPTFNFSGTAFTSPVPTPWFHAAARGGVLYVAAVESGFLRLYEHPWTTVATRTPFPGPPRAGFSAPYPFPYNIDLACEAAAPNLTFVEDSLILTWQERCAPQTRWNVAVRVVR